MAWHEGLLDSQRKAAQHAGSHARLLAGPGTGKTLTLTRHIWFLITELKIPPESIVALTFTRAAARELRQRVANSLGQSNLPRISTLHSFALRQLNKNEGIITSLPQPLRIADDWEERNIILEDLKSLIGLRNVVDARELLHQLSSDWESLIADEDSWEQRYPNPKFLAAWREHRKIYGYTLRSELVYQLKKNLETRGDFELESPIHHLVVDEYQDLNKCDISIVKRLADRDCELFIAGDDDQSIYGFRKAHPDGIRHFPKEYNTVTDINLEICMRCDRKILDIGLFVAQQDYERIDKAIHPGASVKEGEVKLLRFKNQNEEARGIADLCKYLSKIYDFSDILILLRSDRNKAFSRPIVAALEREGIPASVSETANLMNTKGGRSFLAFLRILVHLNDSLAWRTLFENWFDGIGPTTVKNLYSLSRQNSKSFSQIVLDFYENPQILPSRYRKRLYSDVTKIMNLRDESIRHGCLDVHDSFEALKDTIIPGAEFFVSDEAERSSILSRIEQISGSVLYSLKDILALLGNSEDAEPDIDERKVNILTMHRAKGLTYKAVIVAAAEDEYIPGRSENEGDERRLLYVSLTRAQHHLFITYCDRRIGQQLRTGREGGKATRSITRFLRDSPFSPQAGPDAIADLGGKKSEGL